MKMLRLIPLALALGPAAVLIGIAPKGGQLPSEWRGWLGEALDAALGATIERVLVDVSGEAYLDVEKEAMAIMSRD